MGEWGLLFTLSILWGGSFFFNGVAVRQLPTLTIVAARVAMAAVMLWGVVLLGQRRPIPHGWRLWRAFLLTSSPPRGARIPSLRRDMVAPPDSGGLTLHGLPPPQWSDARLHVRLTSPPVQRRGCF